MTYKKAFKSEEGKMAVMKVYDDLLSQWRMPHETFNVDSNYGRTFIIKSGNSALPPLILLHGTSSNSTMWINDMEEFSKHFCVYAVDIPGEPGKSEEKQYSLKSLDYFDWLHEIIGTLNLSKVSIVGISLGGWLAVGYTSRYPEMVDKLVLLCPSGIGSQKISFVFKSIPLMLLGDWGLNKITHLINGNQSMPREVEEYTKLIARNFNLRKEAVPIYLDNELKRLQMPLLLFVGEKDVLLHSRETFSRISSLIPHACCNLLPDYGHVLIGLKGRIVEFLLKDNNIIGDTNG